jgi:hypothetical protein
VDIWLPSCAASFSFLLYATEQNALFYKNNKINY